MPIEDVTKFREDLVLSEKNLLDFLKKDFPKAYSPTELSLIFNRDRTTVSTLINRLKVIGVVDFKKDGRNRYYYYNGVY